MAGAHAAERSCVRTRTCSGGVVARRDRSVTDLSFETKDQSR